MLPRAPTENLKSNRRNVDSQVDSQAGGRPRMRADAHGMCRLVTEQWRKLVEGHGH
jgi:hypothetical protein